MLVPRPAVLVWFLLGFVAVGALIVAVLWTLQRRLIYFPGGTVPPVEDVLPGWWEVRLTTTDGLDLGAWYAQPVLDRQTPVVVVLPGNAGARADRAPLGSRLAESGLGVLLVDYRGYGGNPGHPSAPGLAMDARAAVRYLATAAPDHPVVLFGESLGAAVAIELAVDEPPAALILRSPFTSIADVADVHYGPRPPEFLLRDRYPSDERIGLVEAPVLIIAGSDDSIVPLAQSRELYDLAREPKEFVEVPGADHNDADLLAGDTVIAAVVRFIDTATPEE
ncbi:MAG: alpha/beta hydrolase [Acidimicrobiia bacterium]|nr:alpha/beta hydrolase [Acidimicrobiia bacterium]